MADISLSGAHDYWKNFQDDTVYRVIVLLESVERNYYDGNEAYEKAMSGLEDALSMMRNGDDLTDRQAMLDVLAYTKTSRYLRILQALDEVTPGAASRVIAEAEKSGRDNQSAQLFLQRNIIFERFRLLPRVLASDRLEMIVSALGE
ncbi:MAG: type IVB secretion system protein IcmW [Pseudomonadota bacterium]|nr:type IVB secretion system protein IcmW [Pseudomonadota bacterium]